MTNQQKTPVAVRLQQRSDPVQDPVQIEIDGTPVSAYAGESVAAVLMLSGVRVFTQANRYNLSRTLFCGMGICHQCLVTVNGIRDVRACMTTVQPEMKIETRWRIESNETS